MNIVFILLEINVHSIAEASAIGSGLNDVTEFLFLRIGPNLVHHWHQLVAMGAGFKGLAFVAKHKGGKK